MNRSKAVLRSPDVLFVSTSYPTDDADWKGRFVDNLVKALSRRQDLRLRVWAPPGILPPNVRNAASPTESAWLQELAKDGGIAHVLRTRGVRAAGRVLGLLFHLRRVYARERQADIVHVNWIQNAVPLLGSAKPAVISVLGSDYGMLRYPGMQPLLRCVFRRRRCLLAPNAGWMAPRLKSAFGSTAAVRTIPYGVDDRWFGLARNPAATKASLWLAVYRVTADKIGPLFEWGRTLFSGSNELHLIGPMQERIALPEWVHYHGPASPEELLAKWFPQARGLITLSRHNEGRPQVILEAMAAGLPVIASNLPAHRDVIRHGRNGWLVKTPGEFEEALCALGRNEIHSRTAAAAHAWVKSEVGTWDDCAERHARAYHELIGERRHETR